MVIDRLAFGGNRWHAIQGEGLAPGIRANGDAVIDGCGLDPVEAGVQFELKMWTDRTSDQQAALQILLGLLRDELRQMSAERFELLHKARIVPGND